MYITLVALQCLVKVRTGHLLASLWARLNEANVVTSQIPTEYFTDVFPRRLVMKDAPQLTPRLIASLAVLTLWG